MNARLRYRTVSANQAIQQIKGGGRVILEGSLSEPISLIEAMLEQKDHFKGLEIITASPIFGQKLADESMAGHFSLKTLFARGGVGKAIQQGRADYIPASLWGMTKAIEENILPIDVAMIQVSPPDDRGYCSFGINVSYVKAAAANAQIVIAELNDQMPRTLGDASISIDKIDYICEVSRSLPVLEPSVFSEEETRIAEGVAALIPSGATIEAGIGSIPSAIFTALKGKEDLGLHTGMISDAMMEQMKDGIITNRRKPFDAGKSVASMAMGSRELYEWIRENPRVALHPSSYTHAIDTISRLDNFIAINSGLQVDLTGQVNAEMVDGTIVSGVGGGICFARGACASRRGLSIIALPSTAEGGKLSRIVPFLAEGTPVTYHRCEVDFVVTEHGIADLRCRSLQERERRLVQIAHPGFQDALTAAVQGPRKKIADQISQ
jgi:4-hydroxybutyrate CoA-transferase